MGLRRTSFHSLSPRRDKVSIKGIGKELCVLGYHEQRENEMASSSERERTRENSSLDEKVNKRELKISNKREKARRGKKKANKEECRDCIIP